MNKLITTSDHQRAISAMPSNAQELMNARFLGKKISELPDKEAADLLKKLIQKCIILIGHYKESEDIPVIEYIGKNLYSEILENRKNLTDLELHLILTNGAKGQYKRKPDEFISCNFLSINLWVDAFYDDSLRKITLADYNFRLSDSAEKIEPTESEAIEIVRKGCIDIYRQFLIDESMPVYGAPYYKYLKNGLKIEWSDLESEEIKTVAKQRSIGNETNYSTECKNVALKKWFTKMKSNFTYDQFKSLTETINKSL